MKQLLKLTAVSALALTALTTEAGVRQGTYVIAGVGYTNLNANGRATATPAQDVQTQKLDKKASGAEFDLTVGYEWTTPGNSWVVGAEIFGGFGTAETKQDHDVDAGAGDTRTDKVKLTYSTGISINPGVEIANNWTLYLKLMGIYSNFKITNQTNAAAGYAGSNKSYGLWGFAPGLRLKYAFDECWAVTLDSYYAMYQSKKSKNFDPTAGQSYTVKISPKVWSTVLGVSYKF